MDCMSSGSFGFVLIVRDLLSGLLGCHSTDAAAAGH